MKDIQEFLSLLDKVKKTGNSQWMACCPAHGDDTPSLAISEDNRKILVHCHAGCTPENIASAVGLRVNDLFLDDVYKPTPAKLSRNAPHTVLDHRHHDYKDENGIVICRKTIEQCAEDNEKHVLWYRFESGNPVLGLNGKKAPLYNLDKLAANYSAADPQPIYIAEGEKDADTLSQMGLVATTSPNGAGSTKWLDTYNTYLNRGQVYILTDNDQPGEHHGVFIANHLVGIASSVKIIPATAIHPTVKPKGDISDIAKEIGLKNARTALEKAVSCASEYTKTLPELIHQEETTGKGVYEELGFFTMDQLSDEDRTPPEFIVEGMIPVGITFLSGAPKTRKSFLALDLAVAVATGSTFLGLKTNKCSVAYLDLEGSKARIAAREEAMGIKIPSNVHVTTDPKFKISSGLVDKLRLLHRTMPEIRLIIIDTYSRARGSIRSGGQNAYDLDVQLLEPIQRMALEEKIAILFIHHDKKGSGAVGDVFERLSGTMGISGSADCVMNLIADGKRFDGKANLEYTPRDAKGGEMKLVFSENTCQWNVDSTPERDIADDPLVKWILDNAPDKNKEGVHFSYQHIDRELDFSHSDTPGSVISKHLEKLRDELFVKHKIGVQIGVSSNGARGIRITKY